MHALLIVVESYACLMIRCWSVYSSLSRTFLDYLKPKCLASIIYLLCIRISCQVHRLDCSWSFASDNGSILYSYSCAVVADLCFILQGLSPVNHSSFGGCWFCWLRFWWRWKKYRILWYSGNFMHSVFLFHHYIHSSHSSLLLYCSPLLSDLLPCSHIFQLFELWTTIVGNSLLAKVCLFYRLYTFSDFFSVTIFCVITLGHCWKH